MACTKEPSKRTSDAAATTASADRDKTTHTSSTQIPSLPDRVAFLERYVTFRRRYDALDFMIDYNDDTSRAPGPSAVGCDVRLFAKVPAEQLGEWTASLDRVTLPPPSLTWTADIPGAPKDLDRFAWYRQKESIYGGDRIVGIAQASAPPEIFYRLVCARN